LDPAVKPQDDIVMVILCFFRNGLTQKVLLRLKGAIVYGFLNHIPIESGLHKGSRMTWTLDDINWNAFDRSKATPTLISLVKAACMVEHNGYDYGRYLHEVFGDDPQFTALIDNWAEEEVQHGKALRGWAERADPTFDFDKSFRMFTEGYKLPLNVAESVRGSRAGELIARCVVETGTSSYYTAIADATDEPLLKEICLKIAADEFRHYKLFYTHLKRYLDKEKIGFWKRLWIALGRIAESEDDELAYAYYAAHQAAGAIPETYNRTTYTKRYLVHAGAMYRKWHIERMVGMVLKVVGVKPGERITRLLHSVAWGLMQFKLKRAAA